MPAFDSQSIENSHYSNNIINIPKSLNSKTLAKNDSFYAADKNLNYFTKISKGRYSSKPSRPATAIRRQHMQKLAVK
jgi:hypothetical protein